MSNFFFLADEWPAIHEEAARTEAYLRVDPRAFSFYARRTLEQALFIIFESDASLRAPRRIASLGALIYQDDFRAMLTPDIFLKMKTVTDLGNRAVSRPGPVPESDALHAARELHHILYWFARSYSIKGAAKYAAVAFDPAGVPTPDELEIPSRRDLEKQEEEARTSDRLRWQELVKKIDLDQALIGMRQKVAAAKKRNAAIPDDHDYTEAETRDFFIDLMLKEAGWPLINDEDREFKVTTMPTKSGVGYVDYVLWGDNGLPLGLVEAKKAKKDPVEGKKQAENYADCLQRETGQRPVIFYSNGYETYLWDDHEASDYGPRMVQGFYKKDELELMIARRETRKNLAQEPINRQIVDRPYQEEAIRRVTERLSKKKRSALVVMATGAGKTRTVVALSSLLQKANWVKRILFLADRQELVSQGEESFEKHMPDSTPVNLLKEKGDPVMSRVYVSTYHTMMRLIDQRNEDQRLFSPGFFDLVIIDEAHRSVYQKFRSIFDYFDSFLVGLTATPRAEIDRNTFNLFNLETDVPTFAYELHQAIDDGFLVPAQAYSTPLKIPNEGLVYSQLSAKEKEAWEELEWDDEGNIPDAVRAAEVNQWFFNLDTVDLVLKHLWEKGLKIEGGDKLGKTIIFARNKEHAKLIAERAADIFPPRPGKFAQAIYTGVSQVKTLIDDFKDPNKDPYVAISVDMLDTGVDVPEIVNLVYFKTVRSKTKFLQMNGRGTRLRKDLFGPGKHKEFFYIFDFCRNLEFFEMDEEEAPNFLQESLSKRLFLRRLELVRGLDAFGQTDARDSSEIPTIRADFRKTLEQEVAAMNIDNFLVRRQRRYVEKFKTPEAWDSLSEEEYVELAQYVAGLPAYQDHIKEEIKRFDLLVYQMQLAVLNGETFARMRTRAKRIAAGLEGAANVPEVGRNMELIQEMQTDTYWEDITIPMLERMRKALRELVIHIDKKARKEVTGEFEDELGEEREIRIKEFYQGDITEYRMRVIEFLEAHKDNTALYKLKHNHQITPADLEMLEELLFESGSDIGDREKFEKTFGEQEHLGVFVRELSGLDRGAAKMAFGRYLDQKNFNAEQIRFVNEIIDHLTIEGVMKTERLYLQPYTDAHPSGLDGVFEEEQANKIEDFLKHVRARAIAKRDPDAPEPTTMEEAN